MTATPAAAGPRRVLFVCHANTSRSSTASAMMLRLLRDRGLDHAIAVGSGGIAPFARDGSLVSLDAKFVLREIGIPEPPKPGATDLKRNRHHLSEADLILVMTEEQRRMLSGFEEAAGKRVLTLRELAGDAGDIEDPSMQPEDVFRHCRDQIVDCLERGFPRLFEE